MKAEEKVHKVMHEFKEGKLKSHGETVTDRNQAIAIALSSAREIDPNYQMKDGGEMYKEGGMYNEGGGTYSEGGIFNKKFSFTELFK